MEKGETSSAYFFRLEKKCGTDRWLSAIRLDDDPIVSSPAELCASFAPFYTFLCSAAPTDPVIHASLLANVSSSLAPDMVPSVRGISLSPNVLLPLEVWLGIRS